MHIAVPHVDVLGCCRRVDFIPETLNVRRPDWNELKPTGSIPTLSGNFTREGRSIEVTLGISTSVYAQEHILSAWLIW